MATKCGLCGGSLIANPLNKDNKNPLFHSYACEKCGKTGNKYTHIQGRIRRINEMHMAMIQGWYSIDENKCGKTPPISEAELYVNAQDQAAQQRAKGGTE